MDISMDISDLFCMTKEEVEAAMEKIDELRAELLDKLAEVENDPMITERNQLRIVKDKYYYGTSFTRRRSSLFTWSKIMKAQDCETRIQVLNDMLKEKDAKIDLINGILCQLEYKMNMICRHSLV